MAPLLIASSMMAARISGGIFRPGSATALTHILMKCTPSAVWLRTSSRASSSVVGAFRPAALNPPGYENPSPAVKVRGASGRPPDSSRWATRSGESLPMLRAVVTP